MKILTKLAPIEPSHTRLKRPGWKILPHANIEATSILCCNLQNLAALRNLSLIILRETCQRSLFKYIKTYFFFSPFFLVCVTRPCVPQKAPNQQRWCRFIFFFVWCNYCKLFFWWGTVSAWFIAGTAWQRLVLLTLQQRFVIHCFWGVLAWMLFCSGTHIHFVSVNSSADPSPASPTLSADYQEVLSLILSSSFSFLCVLALFVSAVLWVTFFRLCLFASVME